jgi:hypothetical protein
MRCARAIVPLRARSFGTEVPQDDVNSGTPGHRGESTEELDYWPSLLSILLATFTPLNPLTYFEIPR